MRGAFFVGDGLVNKTLFVVLASLFFISTVFAKNQVVELTVGYKTVYFAGKAKKAIAVNGQVPAPCLHFKMGDRVTIKVHNTLDQETAIHWHGILVPWQMDGVLGVSQQGIPPGGVFQYRFTLRQSGTYWYHAHAGLQEQQGLYGAFLIDPPHKPAYTYVRDYVVVLSDWSNTGPDKILANLKKDGDYYSPYFPLQPSLLKFIQDYQKAPARERQQLIDDYKMMQQSRMSIYDLSDVAYDAFLLNGQPNSRPWTAQVKVGDVVRLRFIGASGSTIFKVKIPGASMQLVQVDGNEVRPYAVHDFSIAPGETYDVLVKIQKSSPYIIYAESRDTVGAALGALLSKTGQTVNYRQVSPFPEPLPVSREMMSMSLSSSADMQNMGANEIHKHSRHPAMLSSVSMSGNTETSHSMTMSMPTEPTIVGDILTTSPGSPYLTSPGTQYQNIVAAVKTNDPHKPVSKVIKMELFGYMGRYIWFINGVPGYLAKPIIFEPGKRYRFVFSNTSMMHHPMHIHGHWFILRKGQGAYDPLLHTIDVPPGATMTADLDTDASGQWFFHCHLLYHMAAGMSRVFQYSTLIEITKDKAKPQDLVKPGLYRNRPLVRVDEVRPLNKMLIRHPEAHAAGLWLATFIEAGEDPFHQVQQFTYKGLYGSDYNKLELFSNDAELDEGRVDYADMDIFYWHLINQFWAIKGGVNYFYRPATVPYWQPGIGIEGLMPYFIDTDLRGYYYSGSAKLDLELSRDTQITNNFFVRLGIRSILASKSVPRAQIGSGLNQLRYILRPYYRLMPGLNLFAEYEYQQYYGVFKNFQSKVGEAGVQNTLTLGLAILF